MITVNDVEVGVFILIVMYLVLGTIVSGVYTATHNHPTSSEKAIVAILWPATITIFAVILIVDLWERVIDAIAYMITMIRR